MLIIKVGYKYVSLILNSNNLKITKVVNCKCVNVLLSSRCQKIIIIFQRLTVGKKPRKYIMKIC